MSWKKFKRTINLTLHTTIYGKSPFYFASVGNLIKSTNQEILSLSYNDQLSAFSSDGKLIANFPFSSKICSLFLKDIFDDRRRLFVSFSFSGNIRVFTKNGDVIWNEKISSSIIEGIVGNLDYDPGLEIIALLDDQQIIVLNNQGQIIAKYKHTSQIKFINVTRINSSKKKVIIFVDIGNNFNILDIEESVELLPIKINPVIAFTPVELYDFSFIAVVNNQNIIQLMDKKGNIFETYQSKNEIQFITSGKLLNSHCDSIIAISAKNYIEIINIEVKNPKMFINEEEINNNSSLNKKIHNKTAKLELNTELYHKKPKYQTLDKDSSKIPLEKEFINNPDLNSKFRCPECGDYLPPMLVKLIMSNKSTYCEECGKFLERKDFKS